MSAIIRVLKALAGFSGSLLMFFGIILLFLTMISSSMVDNIGQLDQSAAATMQAFVQENKVEVREFLVETMQKQGLDITKEQVKVLCASPSMLDMMAGEQGAAFKSALTPAVCDNIDTASFEETKAKLVDNAIENNIDSIVKLPQTQELKESIEQQGKQVTAYSPYFIGFAIGLFIIGGVLTFAGVGFNWKRGTYKVCIKTGIRLATTALGLFLLSMTSSNLIIDTMKAIESQAPQMMVSQAPPLLLKLLASVVLDWLKLSTNPYILIALIAGLPFIAAAVIMRFTILKKSNEEKNPANKKVV